MTRLLVHCGLLEILLFELKRKYDSQPYLQSLYLTLFAIGYYGLMRVGELTFSPHVVKARNVFLNRENSKLLLILHLLKAHREELPQCIKIVLNRIEKSGKYAHRNFCPLDLMGKFFDGQRTIKV